MLLDYNVDIDKSMRMPSLMRQAIILKKNQLAGASVDFSTGEFWFGPRQVIPQAPRLADGTMKDPRKLIEDQDAKEK